MRPLKTIAIVVSLFGLVLVLFLVFDRPDYTRIDEFAFTTATDTPKVNTATNAGPAQTTNRPPSEKQIDLKALSMEIQRRDRADRHWQWKVPIEFYGKVIDETGRPIPDVNVTLTWTDLSVEGTSKAHLKTDATGNFSLRHARGKRLGLRLQNPGYYSTRDNLRSFEYAIPFEDMYHHPDPLNPEVFTLRKKGEPETMFTADQSPETPSDGRPFTLNLLTGRPSPTGQFQFQAWRPSLEQEIPNRLLEWHVKISMIGGGLRPMNDEFPFLAPTNGYQPNWIVDMVPGVGTNWNIGIEQHFYFYFGNPEKYGRMKFSTGATSRGFHIEYWLNPSGSRNLEFDPDKRILPE